MASSIVSEGIVLVAVVIAAAALSQVFLTSMAGLEHGPYRCQIGSAIRCRQAST